MIRVYSNFIIQKLTKQVLKQKFTDYPFKLLYLYDTVLVSNIKFKNYEIYCMQTGNEFFKNNKAAISKADNYDREMLYDLIIKQFDLLGIDLSEFKYKKVVLKPNLLMRFAPEKAVTVHPDVVFAVAKIFIEAGASVLLAESPGGPYTQGHLRTVYKTSGMEKASKDVGFELNYDTSYTEVNTTGGQRSNKFCIINPILEADCIVNLCKLKTHSMALMTAAVKNLFGTVPGTLKVEYHSRFPKNEDFAAAIVDLTAYICKTKKVISVCDAIIGMEGNGPSGGNPKKIGCIISSENPFALDLLASHIIGTDNSVTMIENAKARGFIPEDISDLEIYGDGPENFVVKDFILPDTHKKNILNHLPSFLQPRPKVVKKICIGCGECARSCPQKIITIKKHKAHIDRKKCIKCYCCQELCRPGAIKIHRSFIYKIVK